MGFQSMGVVRTLENCRELRVADPSLLPGGADGTWSDPDLDDVGSSKHESFHHVSSHDIASLKKRQ